MSTPGMSKYSFRQIICNYLEEVTNIVRGNDHIKTFIIGSYFLYNNRHSFIWYKKNKIASARYPGGTPSAYWDWENPCGKMDCWSLDPDFDESEREDESEWMSL